MPTRGSVTPAATAAGTALRNLRRPTCGVEFFMTAFLTQNPIRSHEPMPPVTQPTALDAALAALAAGQHRDPFAVLGPHRDEAGRGIVIRAFNPAARSIDLVLPATGDRRAMSRREPHGVFEAIVAGND